MQQNEEEEYVDVKELNAKSESVQQNTIEGRSSK